MKSNRLGFHSTQRYPFTAKADLRKLSLCFKGLGVIETGNGFGGNGSD